ncbi:MAG: hypothetical protein AAFN18_24745 [Cyanobacteria bacterium J06554_6]
MKRPVKRKLGWGLLALSVGLHGLVLRLPMRPLGTLQVPEPELPPPDVIPVTQLPTVATLEPSPETPTERV